MSLFQKRNECQQILHADMLDPKENMCISKGFYAYCHQLKKKYLIILMN